MKRITCEQAFEGLLAKVGCAENAQKVKGNGISDDARVMPSWITEGREQLHGVYEMALKNPYKALTLVATIIGLSVWGGIFVANQSAANVHHDFELFSGQLSGDWESDPLDVSGEIFSVKVEDSDTIFLLDAQNISSAGLGESSNFSITLKRQSGEKATGTMVHALLDAPRCLSLNQLSGTAEYPNRIAIDYATILSSVETVEGPQLNLLLEGDVLMLYVSEAGSNVPSGNTLRLRRRGSSGLLNQQTMSSAATVAR